MKDPDFAKQNDRDSAARPLTDIPTKLLKQGFDVPPRQTAACRSGKDQLKGSLVLPLHPSIVLPTGTRRDFRSGICRIRITLYGRVRYQLCGRCRCRTMQPMGSRQRAPKGMRCKGSRGIVRLGLGEFIRTRYRRRRFSTSIQEIWQTRDIHWPTNENVRIDHCPYASIPRNHKARLIVLWLLSASEFRISWY